MHENQEIADLCDSIEHNIRSDQEELYNCSEKQHARKYYHRGRIEAFQLCLQIIEEISI